MTKKFAFTKFEGFTEIGEGETVPMSAKLTAGEFAVLQIIAMFQGVGGYCDTTQEQMSQMLKLSLRTVGTALKGLEDFTYEGQPIVEKSTKKNPVSKKEQNVYRLLENKLFGVYGEAPVDSLHANIAGNETPLQAKIAYSKEEKITKELKDIKIREDKSVKNEKMTNKQIVSYFVGLLKEKGIDKKPFYPQLMKQMKNIEDLFEPLKNNDIKRVCEIIVEQYESWGTNIQYPLEPNVISRKWVIERALKELTKKKEEVSQIEKQSVEATKRNETSISSIMGRIKKNKGGAN